LIHRHGFGPRQLKTLFVFVRAQELQLVAGARLQSQGVRASARREIKRASCFGQLNVLVNEFRESLAPISGDVEIFEEGEFFLRFDGHGLTIEDRSQNSESRIRTTVL